MWGNNEYFRLLGLSTYRKTVHINLVSTPSESGAKRMTAPKRKWLHVRGRNRAKKEKEKEVLLMPGLNEAACRVAHCNKHSTMCGALQHALLRRRVCVARHYLQKVPAAKQILEKIRKWDSKTILWAALKPCLSFQIFGEPNAFIAGTSRVIQLIFLHTFNNSAALSRVSTQQLNTFNRPDMRLVYMKGNHRWRYPVHCPHVPFIHSRFRYGFYDAGHRIFVVHFLFVYPFSARRSRRSWVVKNMIKRVAIPSTSASKTVDALTATSITII